VLIGEAGTGKTHLALGLCVAACQQRRRVRLWLFLNFCTVASVNLRGTATVIGSALFLYVFITAA
jgi:hypothetical protein